jgi:UDP-glucose 6-dehydrogenase
LGYVGSVSASCLAALGHEVIGVEPSATKVDRINSGASPVKEPGLDALVQRVVAAGRLRAVDSGIAMVAEADVSLICVGTPLGADATLGCRSATAITWWRCAAPCRRAPRARSWDAPSRASRARSWAWTSGW